MLSRTIKSEAERVFPLGKLYLQGFYAGPSNEGDNCSDKNQPETHYNNPIIYLLG